jgi:SHS family sialic acid transporter-like MFS transporter
MTTMSTTSPLLELSRGARYAVLAAAFGGLVFDGIELGLMPVASLSVTKSLLGDAFTDAAGGKWFAWFTAALMLGAAVGGSLLGKLGAGINVGILLLSQIAQVFPITPDSWRWIFGLAAVPALLGIVVLAALPESPKWLASRGIEKKPAPPLGSLFRGELLRPTLVGILLASVPLVGAWAGSKWMIPWADHIGGATTPGYKATTQQWWAIGATIGSFLGAPLAAAIGRRLSYTLISIGATLLTWAMFKWTAPLESSFLLVVFAQGLVATLFFGWLPLYLPELFPVHVRATGAGISMNIGRFATAGGVLAAGGLFSWFGGDYSAIGAACSLVYALGIFVIILAPNTRERAL